MNNLVKLAREAGAAGREWMDWTASHEVQALIDAHDGPRGRLVRECERAYAEGRREHLRKTWVTVWTTAPADYDTFGAETVEEAGEWRGKALREVLVDPRYLTYQQGRYDSGMHGSWLEDPRVELARAEKRLAEERAERQAREARQAEGSAWLAALSDRELDRVADGERDSILESFQIGWTQVREEKKRRQKLREERERAETWAKCRPVIPPGCVLVDDGDEGGYAEAGGIAYRRPRRDARVYYDVSVVEIDQDAERSYVAHGRESLGSLADVAYQLENGRLRVADPSEVPPKKVLDRIGHDRLKEVRRVEVRDRVVWLGRARFSSEVMILDDRGRLVRSKAIVAEALTAIEVAP